MKLKLAVGLGLAVFAAQAWAQIGPTFTTFGPLPAATFSGTGIENAAVAITTGPSFTMGLTAHARFGVPPLVTNNGAGTFYATTGIDTGTGTTVGDPWAKWNVDYYVNGNTNLYFFKLFYDFDPAVGNAQAGHGNGFVPTPNNSSNATAQDSINMGFNYLATTSALFGITAPAFGPFDPTLAGEYSFALVAFSKTTGMEVARSAILVSAVPEASTYAMLLAGLAAVGFVAKRRRA
jgi:PEP-CTERM motif